MYAEVALNRPVFQTFTYSIPAHLDGLVQRGYLVKVPFRTAYEAGIVLNIADFEPEFTTKPIVDRLDPRPVVTPVQIELAAWMAEQTHTPIGLCLWLMLPPGLTQKSDTLYSLINAAPEDGLFPAEKPVVSLLQRRGALTSTQLREALKGKAWKSEIDALVKRGIVQAEPILAPPKVKPKVVRTATLSISPAQIPQIATQLGRESKRANVLEVLANIPYDILSVHDVLEMAGCGISVVRALDENGDLALHEDKSVELLLTDENVQARIIELRGGQPYLDVLEYLVSVGGAADVSSIYKETGVELRHLEKLHDDDLITLGESEIWRDSVAEKPRGFSISPPLTPDQAEVWEPVRQHMLAVYQEPAIPHNGVYVLHGVTGSGKTEVYMRAVETALAQGRQAIMLVPEIALTAQMIQRFASRFPGQVVIVHGSLSQGERYDTWRRARDGQISVVIGARSALFTPFPDVGVIILDEEHDDSYKQSPPVPAPYYHARDTAIQYMKLNHGSVILGSATPDIITYYRAERGDYHLLHLSDRVLTRRDEIPDGDMPYELIPDSDAASLPLPPVQLVDMRQELRVGHTSVFSRPLIRALHETLAAQHQAMLFLNRRGTATYVFCRDCGFIVKCERCDTPLTYHRPREALVCHRCGHHQPNPAVCPQCHSRRIKYFGRGTEQIEQILQTEFPDARVLRWDQDTASGRGAHEEIYEQFANHEADFLIGTQMITKGLDLPLVTLVGVISADTALGLPDYRANENTFQLLMQVAGRSGRGISGGRVIFQTYQPEHYAIQAAADHDYLRFYREEIRHRRTLNFPPFTRLARMLFRDKVEGKVQYEAEQFARRLSQHIQQNRLANTIIIGPAPCFFTRINEFYRWHVLIRTPDPVTLFQQFDSGQHGLLDIDPVDIL